MIYRGLVHSVPRLLQCSSHCNLSPWRNPAHAYKLKSVHRFTAKLLQSPQWRGITQAGENHLQAEGRGSKEEEANGNEVTVRRTTRRTARNIRKLHKESHQPRRLINEGIKHMTNERATKRPSERRNGEELMEKKSMCLYMPPNSLKRKSRLRTDDQSVKSL